MPLIDVTTTPDRHPELFAGEYAPQQHTTIELAKALPGLFVAGAKELRLDPDTSETAVQVMHHVFSEHDVNVPDMWLRIQFSEVVHKATWRREVRDAVREILFGWFEDTGFDVPTNFAVDCFWGPSRGFLDINGTAIEW